MGVAREPRGARQRDPYLPFYGDDWFGSECVMLMTLAAQGAYLRLLWHAWRKGSIPNDPAQLARMVGAREDEFAALWPEIEPCWTVRRDRLVQPHLEEIRQEAAASRKRRTEAGRKAAASRWDSERGANAVRSHSHGDAGECHPNSTPTPNSTPKEGGSPHPPEDDRDESAIAVNGRGVAPPLLGGMRAGVGEDELDVGKAFDVLIQFGYRNRSATQSADVIAVLKRFAAQGGDNRDLDKLMARARRKTKGDPAALLAHWLDNEEWQKELTKR